MMANAIVFGGVALFTAAFMPIQKESLIEPSSFSFYLSLLVNLVF